MTAHLLNSSLKERYQLLHFNISKRRSVDTKARFDLINIAYGLLQPIQFFWLMMRHRPAIVYTNFAQNLAGFLRYASFIVIAALFNTKIVVRVMGDGFNHFVQQASGPLNWAIMRIVNRVDIFVVRAETLKRQFDGIAPLHKQKVIYLGIDVQPFIQHEKTQDDNTIRILFVGYLTKAKGALDLLQAIPLAVKDNPQIEFQLMGARLDIERNIVYVDNPSSNESILEQRLTNPDIAPYLKLLGVQSGVSKITSFVNADIFIMPSYSESGPLVVLEAMAAGLPVIATPVGFLPEAFNDEHILFVEPGNIEQIALALNRLILDPNLRRKMGDLNRQFVQRNFDLESYASQVDQLFQSLL